MTEVEYRWRMRVKVAWVVYGAGVLCALVSVPLAAWVWDLGSGGGYEVRMMEVLTSVGAEVLDGGLFQVAAAGGLAEMIAGLSLLFGYALVLPAGLLLWLAGYRKACLWAGRVFWAVLLAGGPPVIWRVVGGMDTTFQAGYWLFGLSLFYLLVAFCVTGTREDAGGGGGIAEDGPS